jgi:hypothetical protein
MKNELQAAANAAQLPAKAPAARAQRSPRPRTRPQPAPSDETSSLVAFSESDAPIAPSERQRRAFAAWRGKTERLASEDPEAYREACRTGRL